MQKSCCGLLKMLMLGNSMSISIFITFCLFTSMNPRPSLLYMTHKEQNKKEKIQNRRKNAPKQGRDLGSVICTHSNWKIEVLLRISDPETIFKRKKNQINEENQCIRMYVSKCVSVVVMCVACVHVQGTRHILSTHAIHPLLFYMHFSSNYRHVMKVRIY